ncbi:substrate-binding periplasmic protein [Niveispirillum sp. KHB5.9]|uniref:substrate-binding periplasmic protein n=1 Tax=Niveispirillum sp. KHB5.9 TaxID=3400269 RepID=UPI003A89A3C9
MNKIHVAGLLATMLSVALPAAHAKELSFRADAWCPYNCEPGKAPGYLVEIAGLALTEAGHKVDYKLMPWSDALAQVQAGRFSAAVGASVAEAPALVFPRESLGSTQTILVTLKGRGVHATGLKSLDGLRIGFGADYFYEESVNAYLDAHKKEPRMVAVGGDNLTEDLIRLLVDGKVDAIIEDVNVIDYQAETKGYQGIFDYTPIGKPSSVSIGFSPADPDARVYAALVDAKMRQLRTSGELKKIMARYGLREPQ